MTKINELKTGAILSYISMLLQNIISLIYTPFMLHCLGKSEFGLYALMGSIVAFLAVLDLGFGNTLTRYIAKFRVEGDKKSESNLVTLCLIIYGVIGVISLIIGAILYFSLDNIFNNLTSAELARAKIMFAIMIFNIAVSFPINAFGAIMTGYEKFILPRAVIIIRTILFPCIMVPLFIFGYKAVAIVILNTIFNLITGFINVYYVLYKLKVRIQLCYFDKKLLSEVSKFSFFIFIGILVDQLYWRTGQVLLGVFASPSDVAVFAIAIMFCNYYIGFSTAISGVFLPRITQMSVEKSSNKNIDELFARTGRIQLIVLGYVLGGFWLFGKSFIHLWVGPEYSSVWFISIVIMLPLTVPLIQNVGISILQAKNMHGFRSIMYLMVSILNLLISIYLVKILGGLGTALGITISLFLGNIIIINFYYHLKVNIDIPKFFLKMVPIIFSIILAIVIGGVTLLLRDDSWLMFITQGIIYTFIYCLTLWFVGINKYEKELIIKPFRIMLTMLKSRSA